MPVCWKLLCTQVVDIGYLRKKVEPIVASMSLERVNCTRMLPRQRMVVGMPKSPVSVRLPPIGSRMGPWHPAIPSLTHPTSTAAPLGYIFLRQSAGLRLALNTTAHIQQLLFISVKSLGRRHERHPVYGRLRPHHPV